MKKINFVKGNEKIEFTGERLLLESMKPSILKEHLERYYFAKGFVKNKNVLDIASGTGYGTNILSEVSKTVCGGDISKEAIKLAKKSFNNKKVTFKVLDATNINIPFQFPRCCCFF